MCLFGRDLLRQYDIDNDDADEKLAIAAAFHDIHVFETLDYLASEDELFEQMCALGRERRDAKPRLDTATQALS